jgi:hypothetical protein
MPEEQAQNQTPEQAQEQKQKVSVEIISDEPWIEITPEGDRLVGRRIAFSTPDIPYRAIFIKQEEYSEEEKWRRIAEEIKKFKPAERITREIEI